MLSQVARIVAGLVGLALFMFTIGGGWMLWI
jgi:hypothetical protein